MARFSEGFLRGISNFGRMDPTEPARRLQQATPSVYQQMGTTDPLARRVGSLFSNLGVDTSYMQTAPERIAAETEGLDMSTIAGQKAAIETQLQYTADPQVRNALMVRLLELSTLEKQQQKQRDAQNQFVERKMSLANSAVKLGLTDIAERIPGIMDPEELKNVATELRKLELEQVPTQNPIIRKKMANAAGISDDLFKELELAKVSDKTFTDYLSGQKGKPEFFLKDGKVQSYRVNKESGLVWDFDQNKWVEASSLGLEEPPPQVQKVENITQGMGEELSKVGAKNFVELSENAGKAADALSSINRSLPILDNMYTGAAAEIKLNIARYAEVLGIPLADPSSIADTEAYIADSGRRVAQYIVNLGAGTGLSDADRKYAERVVAGDITLDRETLRRLLKDMRKGAQNKIDAYKTTRARIKQSLGDNADAALAWFPEDFYVDEGPVQTRSPAAQSWLDANQPR